jgi:DNA-binding response OmpR family regulator
MKILLIEDDVSLSEALEQALKKEKIIVDRAADGEVGWELATAFSYDLIVLDILLPKLNGIELCQRLRAHKNATPILLLTAQDSHSNRVLGLNSGADDFLAKPFDFEELLARIRSLVRRSSSDPLPMLKWGNLTLDRNRREVTYHDQALLLTPKEYGLLELLLSNKNRILTNAFLADHLWTAEATPSDNVIRTHVKKLRHKLKQSGVEDAIETVYGTGYRLHPQPDEAELQPIPEPVDAPTDAPTQAAADLLEHGLSRLWNQYKQSYIEQVMAFEQTIHDLQTQLDPDRQKLYLQAQQLIHTLIGSVGSFGLERAAQLGHSIEHLLLTLNVNQPEPSHLQQLSALSEEFKLELERSSEELQFTPPSSIVNQTSRSSRLLIVEDDIPLANQLAVEAMLQGFSVDIATTVSEARAAISTPCNSVGSAQHCPNIVLLDLYLPDTPTHGYELLAEFSAATPPIPVIVLTAYDSFTNRVQVARLGGLGFLAKPLFPQQVIHAIEQVLQQEKPVGTKILIVDDDPQLSDQLQQLLASWEFQLTIVTQPQQLWSTLERVNPDLLILSTEIAETSAIDLCQVVRNDLRWQQLPIILLSNSQDSATIQRAFAAGVDDVVLKPIGSELVVRILNRLKRTQLQRARSPL